MTLDRHSPMVRADVMKPGPNGLVFHAAPMAVPGTSLMYDSVTASDCPQGPYEAGYFNGPYANLGAMRAAHPTSVIVSVTPDGAHGAQFIDVESGCAVNGDIPGFLRAGGRGFYTSASNLSAAIGTCESAGIPRSSYAVWSAHWTGEHICGPARCGYPAADGTQFASNSAYDTSVILPGFLAPVPVKAFPMVQEGRIHSFTTGGTARVHTTDGGHTWKWVK